MILKIKTKYLRAPDNEIEIDDIKVKILLNNFPILDTRT